MKPRYIAAAASVPVIILSAAAIVLSVAINRPPAVTGTSGADRPDQAVRVALLNGCGHEGLAARFADALRDRGYDVVNGRGDNADSYDFPVSAVVDRKGDNRGADRIAGDLGISTVIIQLAADPYVIEDYEIILGRDWDTLPLAKEVHQE